MINTKEYINIMKATREVMPLLSSLISIDDEDALFRYMDEIRKVFKVVQVEYDCYELYPRHKLDKYYETVGILIEITEIVGIKIKWTVEPDVFMSEECWSQYNNISPVARFYYNGIEITKLVKL